MFFPGRAARAVQTAPRSAHPFDVWMGYTPLLPPEWGLYAAMRESVPVIDAALDKIVRLTGGFRLECGDPARQRELEEFAAGVRVGPCSVGLHQFVAAYLDSLLTYGSAAGEMVLDSEGETLCALYNAKLDHVRVRRGESPLEAEICALTEGGRFKPVAYPELVLYTPLNPPAGEVRGVSLMRSLPFVTGILLKIFHSTGTNFERVANLRYAVTCKGAGGGERAGEIADRVAAQWADVMDSAGGGRVKDFVAVGDIGIQVIGADNQMLDTQVPVRQMLEQMVAKLGIPPFMLGLHWSSTERMSAQQADILTSELESYRKLLDSVILRICGTFLRLRGSTAPVRVVWDDINLQDEVEAADARLTNARAAGLERQNGGDGNAD